ncbi:MAG: NAD-dependent epimerase/dehydratase family protein [Candidatus Krumholzibacteriota bacterium]|nr:NAD-dependent epimerase/dehydratase family protein [Candidatus Krumholzibacteriota bacterium]
MGTTSDKKVLITGALGQIGSELAFALSKRYGTENVITSDIRNDDKGALEGSGRFVKLDVLSGDRFNTVVREEKINVIYHLAALLSAVAEADPQRAWKINMDGLYNALEASRMNGCSLFVPSSIGAFGPDTPLDNTPQDTIMRPHSMYGVTKVAGELLCDYYHLRYGVDTRGVRYPGIISHGTLPGGGTTDYAVEIFYRAILEKNYRCYLDPDTSLDMMYMPDAIQAAIDLMEAEGSRLRHRNAFNLTAMHFTPVELAAEIARHIPEFEISFRVDPVRQGIADSWPNYMDDSAARKEWGWDPRYDLVSMTVDMLKVLGEKNKRGELQI